jgi:RNA polymerase primary sigma factor
MDCGVSDRTRISDEGDALNLYLRELRRIPLLNRAEELACARDVARGDAQAKQRLIQANLRFVVLIAKQYCNRGVPLEDLVNEGNIGLIEAAEHFDPDRGVHFISYAIWWIRQAILKAIHENNRLIRIPSSRTRELSRIEELRYEGMVETGSAPSMAQIAEKLSIEESELVKLMQGAQKILSLDSPVHNTENVEAFGASLEDRTIPKPEEVVVDTSIKEELNSVLAQLSVREARILRDRYGLAGRDRITLVEAGKKYGLSKERIRQIEKKALRKIRASGSVQHLKIYTN